MSWWLTVALWWGLASVIVSLLISRWLAERREAAEVRAACVRWPLWRSNGVPQKEER